MWRLEQHSVQPRQICMADTDQFPKFLRPMFTNTQIDARPHARMEFSIGTGGRCQNSSPCRGHAGWSTVRLANSFPWPSGHQAVLSGQRLRLSMSAAINANSTTQVAQSPAFTVPLSIFPHGRHPGASGGVELTHYAPSGVRKAEQRVLSIGSLVAKESTRSPR